MAELIVALDLPNTSAALALVDRLRGVRWVKVGSVLFTREGPELVRELAGRSIQVFLDLKWHDIPNTVADAVAGARELGVAMATLHTLGGTAMMQAAVAAGGGLALVGVTVLTSHDDASYGRAIGRMDVNVEQEVGRLAVEAERAGLAGVVCSPREVAVVGLGSGRERASSFPESVAAPMRPATRCGLPPPPLPRPRVRHTWWSGDR